MKIVSFAELGLIEPLRQALRLEGYHTPTPIQCQSIGPLLEGRDLLGCAQTGTGKTAAFALPLLQRLAESGQKTPARPHAPRALVIGPTRELVAQIRKSFEDYGRFLDLKVTAIVGGVGMSQQIRALAQGVDVLVATPGRLVDLMGQGEVDLHALEAFVLDEADRMLDMGFLPDVKRILARLPRERQSMFFSATLPAPVVQLARTLLCRPVQVEVVPQATPAERIEQRVFHVNRPDRPGALVSLVSDPAAARVIVFTRTKRGADAVTKRLNRQGVKAFAIHGNKTQTTRERVLGAFRAGKFHVLVATDLAARGIDIDNVTHVVNYELPDEPECYVHRIGRTARAGATGIAITFCEPSDRDALRAIEKVTGRKFQVETSPLIVSGAGETRERSNMEGNIDRADETSRTDEPRTMRPRRPSGQRRARPSNASARPVNRTSHAVAQDGGASQAVAERPKARGIASHGRQKRRRSFR